MDLCPAGQARAHIVCMVLVALCQQIILVPQSRPRANDRHITYKDIPQLGQLVQTGLAQESAHPGDILLRVVEQMGGHVVGGVDAHGAEFQDVEIALMDAHPLLLEEHRPRRVQLDGKAEQKQQRRQHQQPAGRQYHGQQPLDSFLIHDGSPFYS